VQRLSETASGFRVSKLIEYIGPNSFKARLDSKQLAILQPSPLINANSMARGNVLGHQVSSSVVNFLSCAPSPRQVAVRSGTPGAGSAEALQELLLIAFPRSVFVK
jgi:hypothetical protein